MRTPSLALAVVVGAWAAGEAALWLVETTRRPAPRPLRRLVPDVNRSPARHLQLLPRIGPARARAIVEERRRAGRFARVADLARTRGVGPVTARGVDRLATAGGP